MLQIARSISDTLGVGFLAMQLIKLIGVAFALFGPLNWIAGLFAGLFPIIANFFNINLGWEINGLDIMSVSIALSGTFIIASSIATKEAMSTAYIFRFFMIPYALIIIAIAIFVQVITPVVELGNFSSACNGGDRAAQFYGSSCAEMSPQLRFFDGIFGEEVASAADDPDEDDPSGIGFIFSMMYLVLVLPAIAILVFFFKRLSVNRLLRRVAIAVGAALGLVIISAGYAVATGQITPAELGDEWFGE